jgi:cytochrome c
MTTVTEEEKKDEEMVDRWDCSYSFDRYDVGAGCSRRRAGVQAIVLPCHDIGPDAKIKLGPPLNAIDGRKAGTFEGFTYSPVNKSSGITWNDQAFDKYIRAPMQEMPGTRMAFVGIKNDKDIADVWAYLKQFGPEGAKK